MIYFNPGRRGDIVTQAGFWYEILSVAVQLTKRNVFVQPKRIGL
jgi:hypothetical protein